MSFSQPSLSSASDHANTFRHLALAKLWYRGEGVGERKAPNC